MADEEERLPSRKDWDPRNPYPEYRGGELMEMLDSMLKDPRLTQDEREGIRRFKEEGNFVLWDDNTNIVYSADELEVSFNGPNLQFVVPKWDGQSRRHIMKQHGWIRKPKKK